MSQIVKISAGEARRLEFILSCMFQRKRDISRQGSRITHRSSVQPVTLEKTSARWPKDSIYIRTGPSDEPTTSIDQLCEDIAGSNSRIGHFSTEIARNHCKRANFDR